MAYTIERNETCAMCSDAALLALGDIESMPDYRRAQLSPVDLPPPPVIEWEEDAEVELKKNEEEWCQPKHDDNVVAHAVVEGTPLEHPNEPELGSIQHSLEVDQSEDKP